jgi:hypothetical protein
MMVAGTRASARISHHSLPSRLAVSNTPWAKGNVTTLSCRSAETAMAPSSGVVLVIG